MIYIGINIWQRIISGFINLATYYINSITGNDSNNGSTPGTAFATSNKVPWASNLIVNVADGSYFREEENKSSINNTQVIDYGGGILPIYDGADVITGWVVAGANIFDRSNVQIVMRDGSALETRELPNLWQKLISFEGAGATNRLTAYENGNMSTMTRVYDDVSCSSTPGSMVDANGLGGSPVLFKIHPTGNVNPNTITIEVSVRLAGIALGDNCSVNGIRAQRVTSNNGALQFGLNSNINRVMSVAGTKHNLLIASGNLENAIVCRSDDPTPYEPSSDYFVGFTPDAAGKNLSFKRCFAIGDGPTHNDACLIMHDSSSHNYSNFTGEQIGGTNINFGYNPVALNVTIKGLFMAGFTSPYGGFTDNGNYSYFQIKGGFGDTGVSLASILSSSPVASFTNGVFYNTGSNDGLFRLTTAINGGLLTIQNCTIYNDGIRSSILDQGMLGGVITLLHNIFTYSFGSFGNQIEIPFTSTYIGDYNIFLCDSNTKNTLKLKFNGVVYNTLPAWQAATGQDAHSVALGPADIASLFNGVVSNGDVTLGGAGAGAIAQTIGAGNQKYLDWNLQSEISGQFKKWPSIPQTLNNGEIFVENPGAWSY